MENSIEVKGLEKIYPGFEMKNMNFIVPTGSIVGLIGENGAGKTTLIKSILNSIHISKGEICIFGKDANEYEKEVKEQIGVVLDDMFFAEILKVKDIHSIMKSIYHNWDETYFFEKLKEFGIPKDKMLKQLSKGMKKKVEIVTALSHHPKLLILDEPTSGLDPVIRNEVLDLFLEFIQDETNSILFSTHITSDLEHIADYIAFIEHGNLIFSKDKDELLEQYGLIKCSEEDYQKMDKKDILRVKKNRYDYEILTDHRSEMKKKYSNLVIDKATLEDIMLLYVKGEEA
ncbi:MAG: ABC transporter ATP-binding protein [Firmicutes bacterium]|nr:ABC transporter ATP-binding protein [Bacillota bacterium]